MNQVAERAKILVVDDELVNLDVITGLLNKYYKLVIAKNGEQAFMRLEQPPLPDLILLDVKMPGMDGFEVCRRLKSSPEYKNIPVIFITALDEVDDESRGLTLGAADYIAKPFNPDLVLLRVRNHLELKNQRNALIKRTSELELKTAELEATLEKVKRLEGVIPICMHCKGIRDDKGSWNRLEKYISEHSDAQFSHGICDKCLKEHYPEY